MQTVQLQCGHCQKLMAIGVEHLGSQVHCPHCRSIVQTPAPEPAKPAVQADNWLEPTVAVQDKAQADSIFTEHDQSDTILGEPETPKVEMPAAAVPEATAFSEAPTAAVAPAESESSTEIPKFKPKPIYDKGIVSITLLIFLIPYAILSTGIIIYLLTSSASRSDPLEYLRDPVPETKKGGPKRARFQPQHNLPLSARLRTTLGSPIQAGDLQVTFEHVRLTEDGDLQLVARAKNLSANTSFEPVNDFFVKVDHRRPDSKPYTFLEAKSKGVDNLYNMYLGFYKDRLGKTEQPNSVLGPKDEITFVLTTDIPDRDKKIPGIMKSNDDYTWRVHVRRGFVRVDGRDVSATMVIGVDFSRRDIEEAGKKG